MKYKIFSVGYRCSSAGILKRLNLKTESYPFDWIISRLPIIIHCIETNFEYFLDRNNYELKKTQTIHYSMIDEHYTLICNENIQFNKYYQDIYSKQLLIIPEKLNLPNDTYAYHLAINHHDIFYDADYDYFKRCINRFKELLSCSEPKLYLYIHPILTIYDFEKNRKSLINLFLSFQAFLTFTYSSSFTGLFYILVRLHDDDPLKINTIHEIYNNNSFIYIMYVRNDYIDAGEIYTNNNDIETTSLISHINERIQDICV